MLFSSYQSSSTHSDKEAFDCKLKDLLRPMGTFEFETEVSKQIKALAEVEKIWILYDVDDSGVLEFEEIESYLKTMV